MTTATHPSDQREWIQTLEKLLGDIERWCRSRGWEASRSTKPLHESRWGQDEYEAPMLAIHSPRGISYIEPVARYVVGADGLVEVYAWPTLRRLVLQRKGETWRSENGRRCALAPFVG